MGWSERVWAGARRGAGECGREFMRLLPPSRPTLRQPSQSQPGLRAGPISEDQMHSFRIPCGMVAIWVGTGNPDSNMQWTLVLAGAQGLPRRVRRPRALRRVLDRPADRHDEQSAAMRPRG